VGVPEDLLGLLPPLLVLDAAGSGGGPWTHWLEPAFMLLRDEGAGDASGATAIMAKIADVFLTEIVRRYLSGLDDMTAAVPPAGDSRRRRAGDSRRGYVFTGKPRLTPPWLGSSQRDVTALPRV
jgi:Cupin